MPSRILAGALRDSENGRRLRNGATECTEVQYGGQLAKRPKKPAADAVGGPGRRCQSSEPRLRTTPAGTTSSWAGGMQSEFS